MNEQVHSTGWASYAADHAGNHTDGTVAHAQPSLPPMPVLHHGINEAPDLFKCECPSVVRSMVLGCDPLRLAEAYLRGDIDTLIPLKRQHMYSARPRALVGPTRQEDKQQRWPRHKFLGVIASLYGKAPVSRRRRAHKFSRRVP